MADTYHDWRDGRRNIPKISAEVVDSQREPVETPRLKALCRRGELQIRDEWITHHREAALLTQWFAASIMRTGALARALEQSGRRLDEAAKPLEQERLLERRTAESDAQTRPDNLIRSRRENDHDRRFRAAEAAQLDVAQRFSAALLETLALADLLQRRMAVARIRVGRIHDHTWRRIAVYWQRLVRVHQHGPALNAQLVPLGPTLPEWARDDANQDRMDLGRTNP